MLTVGCYKFFIAIGLFLRVKSEEYEIGEATMPLNLDDKKAIVADVNQVASTALSAVVADYRGLTVAEVTDLRKQARDAGVYLKVVRNTLVRRALADTEFACMDEVFVGPTLLAFAHEEPGAAAKLFKEFANKHEQFTVRGLAINGQLYDAKDIDRVAKLPSHQEALGQLVSVMQAPVSKFVRTLAEPHAKFVRTLAAICDKKQSES